MDSTNEIELKKLPGTAFNYISEDRGEECYVHMLRSNCPARAKLTLKLGAQVHSRTLPSVVVQTCIVIAVVPST